MFLTIASVSFLHNEMIPLRYTCDGQNVSPPLSWTTPPTGTESLVLIIDDPDAPDPAAPKMTWVHWVLYNISPAARGLAEGVEAKDIPSGTLQGTNSWLRAGYGGPCPPIGTHRYYYKLFALDNMLPDLQNPTAADLQKIMQGHILAYAELIGRYRRQ